jgi:hypothetical protein
MTVGLPLLLVLDERAVRTVVAHEVAHARLQHTTGAVNLYDFIVAAANLFDHLDPANTISGRIAYLLLASLLKWVNAEYLMMSRQNELATDREAGERTTVHDTARALVLVHFAAAGMKEVVSDPLEKELLGAIRLPAPPLQRLIEQLDAVRAPRAIDASEQPKDEDDHPPTHARLANLGFATPPQVEMPKTPAAETVLSMVAVQELLTEFNERWRRSAKAAVELQ